MVGTRVGTSSRRSFRSSISNRANHSARLQRAAWDALEPRRLMAITLGPEHVFSGDTQPELSIGQQTAAMFADGPNGVSLAVWQDTRSGGNQAIYQGIGIGTMQDIYAARVRADGTVIDVTPIPVAVNSYNQWSPRAAWNGSNWLVTWNTERDTDRYTKDVVAARVSPDGVVLDATPLIIGTSVPNPNSSTPHMPEGPDFIASDGVDWIVGYDRRSTLDSYNVDFLGVKVLANGTVPNQEGTRYLAGNQNYQDFGLSYSPVNGGEYLNAFSSWNDSTIYLRRFDRNLNLIAGSQRTLPGGQAVRTEESVAGGSSGWALAWASDFQVETVRIDGSGNFVDAVPLGVSPTQSQTSFSVDVAWTGTDYAIVYAAYPEDYSHLDLDLSVRRLPATGGFKGPSVTIVDDAADQYRPQAIGDGNGGVKFSYTDEGSADSGVALAVVSPTDVPLSNDDVSLAAPSQGAADLTSDGTNFLNVFSSSTAYGTRLLAQRITPDGVSLDAEPLVIADSTGLAVDALRAYEIVFQGGRYIVFWQNSTDATIHARTITPDGTVGPVVEVMSTASGVGFNLDNASVNGDKILLSGNSLEGSLHNSTRWARVFDASTLAPLTNRVQIGINFAIAGDAEPLGPNRWVVAWQRKNTHDASTTTTNYAVINADGTIARAESAAGVGGAVPTIVSNGGELATEAMIVSASQLKTINGKRIDLVGAPIGSNITLIDAAGARSAVAGAYDGTNYIFTWTDQRNYPYPAQPRDDVFAARVTVTGTVLDPGGVPVADSFRPEGHGDVAVASGEVVFVYRTFRSEVPYGTYRLAARGMDASDLTPPTLRSTPQFVMETSQSVSFEFNKPLQGVSSSDLILTNTTTGQTIPASSLTVSVTPAGGTSGWIYRWTYTGGTLANGQYTAKLPAGSVMDLAGIPLAADVNLSLFVVNGDANRDRYVDAADQAILTAHLGQSGQSFSTGDLNFDGTVNAADQAILTANWHVWLPEFGAVALPTSANGNDSYTIQPAATEVLAFRDGATDATYRIPRGAFSSLAFSGGGGIDSLTIRGTTGAEATIFGPSSVQIADLAIAHSGIEHLGFDSGGGADRLTIQNGAAVSTVGFQKLRALTIDGGGALDLTDNDLSVTNTPRATIENYIRTAYNFGGWDGSTGLFSSTAKNNPAANTTLGLLSGAEFNDNNGGTFNGATVNNADVLVKYTYFGDVDFNGQVDASDYNLIDFGYTNHLTGWTYGDADHSGGVDASDYNLIDFAFSTQTGVL